MKLNCYTGLNIAFVLIIAGLLLAWMCEATFFPPGRGLKGQINTILQFYGLAVDEKGQPLEGATIKYRVESYPKDWTFETRSRDNDVSMVTFVSGQDGKFNAEISGCKMIRLSAERVGYHHLSEEDFGERGRSTDTFGYQLIASSNLWYKSDPDHPAVYVFVKDGVKEVSVLPCHGGYSSGGSLTWRLNVPAWPKKPSLKGVIYKPPTTQPSSFSPMKQR